MVRERPRPVRDTRRQMMFLPKHNHLPTVLFLVKVRGALTQEALKNVVPVEVSEMQVGVAGRRGSGSGGVGLLERLRGARRADGKRRAMDEALMPVGASR